MVYVVQLPFELFSDNIKHLLKKRKYTMGVYFMYILVSGCLKKFFEFSNEFFLALIIYVLSMFIVLILDKLLGKKIAWMIL